MIKEITLKFEVNENSFKDGNLLLYNKDRGYFYAISPERFLIEQNYRIENLQKEYEEKEKKMREQVSDIERKHMEFLKNYQESNDKLLNMIESFIKAYGGKEVWENF